MVAGCREISPASYTCPLYAYGHEIHYCLKVLNSKCTTYYSDSIHQEQVHCVDSLQTVAQCLKKLPFHVTRELIYQCSHRYHFLSSAKRLRRWPCGICRGQSGARTDFLRVLRFPLPIFVPPIAPQSPSIAGTISHSNKWSLTPLIQKLYEFR
jgi:hypothetical protein